MPPQLLPRLLLSRLLLLPASGTGNIAFATAEFKLINTTIGTDPGSGPDQTRPEAATTVHSHGADNGDGNRK